MSHSAAGCEITYEMTAIDILQHLLRPTRTEEVLDSFYRDFEERHGIRPTAVEVFHAGLNPRQQRTILVWFRRPYGRVDVNEKAVWSGCARFLRQSREDRNFSELQDRLAVGDARRRNPFYKPYNRGNHAQGRGLAQRMHRLAEDFSIDLANTKAVQRLLVDNPIDAFVSARGMDGVPYFTFEGGTFGFAFDITDLVSVATLLREICRLAPCTISFSRRSCCRNLSRISQWSGQPILFLCRPTTESLP